MHCHYCGRDAAYEAESEGVTVGLCQVHFRERVEELVESDELAELREQVDVNGPE